MSQPPDDVVGDDVVAERYGRRGVAPRRRLLLGVAGVVLLVVVVSAFFVWSQHRPDRAEATVVGYQVIEPDRIRVDFDVDKPDGVAAVCRVVAQDRTAGVIGSTDVTIEAAGDSVQKSVTFRTRGTAVVGLVDSCTLTSG
jgi:hypothetical protein